MSRAIVKPGCHHRVGNPDGGVGLLVGPGSIIQVTQQELDSFSDKLELYKLDVVESHPPVVPELEDDEELLVEWIDVTDAARKLADEFNVDLEDIDGTGDGGRILKRDVEAYLDEATAADVVED